MCDPVVAVMRVAPPITVQVITHVNQLLGDNDLQVLRTRKIDPVNVDQHGMHTLGREITIRSTIGARDSPLQPRAIRCPVRRHPEAVGRQTQSCNVLLEERHKFR